MTDTRPLLDESLRDAYLRRLRFAAPPAPSVESLYALHRAQVERIPYESVWIWLGERRTINPLDSVRYVTGPGQRGGYCYHMNGSFATLLSWLGFEVHWHVGGVQGSPESEIGPNGNHLALTVSGLPSSDNPAGEWFIDAGLGDGPHEPMPLLAGEYLQGPFRYRLRPSEAAPGGWRFEADPVMSLVGMDFAPGLAGIPDLQPRHEFLQSSPDSGFVRVVTAFHRDQDGFDALRGRILKRVDSKGETETELNTRDDWYAALADVCNLPLSDVDDAGKAALWEKVTAAHEAWLATARQ